MEDLRESDPDFFLNPRWPVILAAEKAALLGIPSTKHKAGVTSAAGEQKTQVPPKKQARQIVPASGTSGGSSTKPSEPNDPASELEAAGSDPKKLNDWLRKYGRHDIGRVSVADAFANAA